MPKNKRSPGVLPEASVCQAVRWIRNRRRSRRRRNHHHTSRRRMSRHRCRWLQGSSRCPDRAQGSRGWRRRGHSRSRSHSRRPEVSSRRRRVPSHRWPEPERKYALESSSPAHIPMRDESPEPCTPQRGPRVRLLVYRPKSGGSDPPYRAASARSRHRIPGLAASQPSKHSRLRPSATATGSLRCGGLGPVGPSMSRGGHRTLDWGPWASLRGEASRGNNLASTPAREHA